MIPAPARRLTKEAAPPVDAVTQRLARFTVDQYHRMLQQGLVDERTELLEGLVVNRVSRNPPHDEAMSRFTRRLSRLLPDEWLVRVQSAVTLKDSEPEPDFEVVRGPEGAYSQRHPGPRDIVLLIEVADSSLPIDRGWKAEIYARARIPIYWVVNLSEEKIEVYTSPKAGANAGYRQKTDYGKDAALPLYFAGRDFGQLAVGELLP